MKNRNHSSHLSRHAGRAAQAVLVALATFGLLATSGVAHVPARQTFDLPFAFIVGNTECPAGTYTVKRSSEGVMAIVSADNSTKVLFLAQREQCKQIGDASELVFNRYGEVRYLEQIRPSGETSYLKLHRSPEQEAVAQHWAAQRETVIARASRP
jgi:hypothetical protein